MPIDPKVIKINSINSKCSIKNSKISTILSRKYRVDLTTKDKKVQECMVLSLEKHHLFPTNLIKWNKLSKNSKLKKYLKFPQE